MPQSIESYFLMNFAVDTALIWAIARSNGCARLGKILLGGLLSSVYALAGVFFPPLRRAVMQIPLLFFLGIVISGEPDVRRWGTVAMQLFCAAMLLGGFLDLTASSLKRVPAAAAGLAFTAFAFSVGHRSRCTWDVRLCIVLNGHSTSFRALIDSGNRLREPFSGKPVLIAEESLLRSLISDQGKRRIVFRHVAYGGLGGCGTVKCFLPDAILVQRGKALIRAPEAWVALYPGRIPGPARALAPPSFSIIPGKP